MNYVIIAKKIITAQCQKGGKVNQKLGSADQMWGIAPFVIPWLHHWVVPVPNENLANGLGSLYNGRFLKLKNFVQ